ncbi:MAG: hypothetical protein RIS31_210 [Actinomycetota bacterium]
MLDLEIDESANAEFRLAANSISRANIRSEVIIDQIDAPTNLSRHAIAFACDVKAVGGDSSIFRGTGRFILLWDAVPQESWTNNYRIILYAKSPLETDIGFDDDSAEIAWAWLMTSLEQHGASVEVAGGTTTRVLSVGHGTLSSQSHHAELELRASWCPSNDDLAGHLEAWIDLICVMSGLSLHGEGVSSIDRRN